MTKRGSGFTAVAFSAPRSAVTSISTNSGTAVPTGTYTVYYGNDSNQSTDTASARGTYVAATGL